MKIGVYGGSFNPVHLMHKEIVRELLDRHYVDRIIILPTGDYYKKSNLLKGKERMKMLELTFKDDNRVEISDYEFKNNLISAYRSLDYFKSIYPSDEIYFVMGADNLLSFDTWKKYDYILDNYNLLIINRNLDYSKELERYSKYKGEIIIAKDIVSTSISSSEIRDLLYDNKDFDYSKYLDKEVYDYIKEKGFYSKDYEEEFEDDESSEEEFLAKYSDKEYEKMSITTDIVLFSVSDTKKDNYRKVDKKIFSVLLTKRNTPPFKGRWNLPGGFVSLDETLIDCAKRVLFSETNLDDIYLEQLYTFSDVDRDPRTRVITCDYMGLVNKDKLERKLARNACFFNIKVNQTRDLITIEFTSEKESFTCTLKEVRNEYDIVRYEEIDNQYIAFDHLKAILTGINRLKNKVEYSDIAFNLMPKYFTLKELQSVYEAILDRPLLDPVFRRDIANKVVRTSKVKKDGGHRPSNLYCYKK